MTTAVNPMGSDYNAGKLFRLSRACDDMLAQVRLLCVTSEDIERYRRLVDERYDCERRLIACIERDLATRKIEYTAGGYVTTIGQLTNP